MSDKWYVTLACVGSYMLFCCAILGLIAWCAYSYPIITGAIMIATSIVTIILAEIDQRRYERNRKEREQREK